MPDFVQELLRGVISLAVTLIGLGVGWKVGQRLTYQWNLRQKQRESDLATVHDMQRLYGEFFAVWKLWDQIARPAVVERLALSREELLRRACDAEGLIERVFVKLATERSLSDSEQSILCKFRQGYQQLRKSIAKNQALEWYSGQPEYDAFKHLAVLVTEIVQQDAVPGRVSSSSAFEALKTITSNQHNIDWAGVKETQKENLFA